MSKIIEKKEKQDVHTHIDKAYQLFENKLPRNYVDQVLELLSDKTITVRHIRNIKNRVVRYPSTRINILNALVEVAQKYQNDLSKLRELTQ